RTRPFGRSLDRGSADIARLRELLVVDVAGGHLVPLLDEMLQHREAHSPYAYDANSRFLPVHFVLCLRGACKAHTLALSSAASGLSASATSLASTGMLRSIRRRAIPISPCALMPDPSPSRAPSNST